MNGSASTILVVGYAAKSTDDTRGSMASQESAVRDAVERLDNREVVSFYSDNAQSAYRSAREDGLRGPGLAAAFARCTELAATGAAVELWVFHTDRLARGDGKQAAHLAELFFRAHRLGFRLRSVSDDHSVQEPVYAALMGERNSGDSKAKSAHVREGKERQRAEGKRLGGPIVWGYQPDDSAPKVVVRGRLLPLPLIPHPERAPFVVEAFERSARGDGDEAIAQWLNRQGISTTRGNPWIRRTVQHMLTHPIYAGMHRYGADDALVDATDVTPIVSKELWERVQRHRAARDKASEGRARAARVRQAGRPSRRFLFWNLAVCARCGSRMYCERSNRPRKDGAYARWYRCKQVHGETGLCDAAKVDAEAVEVAFVPHLRRHFSDFAAWVGSVHSRAAESMQAAQGQVGSLKAELAALDKTTRKAHRNYERATASDDDAAEQAALDLLTAMERKRRAVQARLDSVVEAVDAMEASEPTPVLLARWWDEFAAAIRGVLDGTGNVEDLNRELRERVLSHVLLGVTPDGNFSVQAFQRASGELLESFRADRYCAIPDAHGNPVRGPVFVPHEMRGGEGALIWAAPVAGHYQARGQHVQTVPAGNPDYSWEPWHWGYVRGC